MKTKKTVSILLVLALICVSFVGCSTQTPTDQEQNSTDQEESTQDTSNLEEKVQEIDYPTTNINGIVPWGAGGGTDTVCRIAASIAQESLGKSIIMNNKGGASGSIGHQYVYDQEADGYTLLFNSEIPALYQVLGLSDLTYDQFEPIMVFTNVAGVIVVEKDSPYDTLEDLINDAKERPGEITLGISGVGGLPHMSSLLLRELTGAEFTTTSYEGDAPLVTNLLGKQLDVTVIAVGSATQYIENGDFKGLAVMSNNRIDSISEVPAFSELMPEAQDALSVTGPYFGVYAKKGTPEPIIEKLTEAFKLAVEDQRFLDYVKTSSSNFLGLSGDDAREYISTWQSQNAWLLYDAGDAAESPEKFGIPRLSN